MLAVLQQTLSMAPACMFLESFFPPTWRRRSRHRIRFLQQSSSVSFSTHCVPLYPLLLDSTASTRPTYRTTSLQRGSSTSVTMPIAGHYSTPTQDHSRSLQWLRSTSSSTLTAAGTPCLSTDSKWPMVRGTRTCNLRQTSRNPVQLHLQHRLYQPQVPSRHRLPHALAGLSGPHSATARPLPFHSLPLGGGYCGAPAPDIVVYVLLVGCMYTQGDNYNIPALHSCCCPAIMHAYIHRHTRVHVDSLIRVAVKLL